MNKYISRMFLVIFACLVGAILMTGCSTPKRIQEKICPPVPKCPPAPVERFEGLYKASEGESDRLEKALAVAEEKYLSCEESWQRYLRKSR